MLKGIKLDPKNPFRFHFFVDTGDSNPVISASSTVIPAKAGIQNQEQLKTEATRLIKYFLASLTIPEKDLWVNLSPYEKDRIVPQEFGQTEMGRDLLAEDYLLKQITASLIYPESQLGKEFWQKVYAQAQAKYGTTNIPINTFNKVWIVPEKAVVYENKGTAFVLENHLKVMLEQDYLSMSKHADGGVAERGASPASAGFGEHAGETRGQDPDINRLGSQIIREIVIPALTKEVNEGKNFAQLRQVFYSLILATWYKKKIKDSILNKVYSNQNKINGLVIPAKAGIHNKNNVETIYQQYLQAFKKGVYNYIKEESDPITNQVIPRKYFSGGVEAVRITIATQYIGSGQVSPAQIADLAQASLVDVTTDAALISPVIKPVADRAMNGSPLIDNLAMRYYASQGANQEAVVERWLKPYIEAYHPLKQEIFAKVDQQFPSDEQVITEINRILQLPHGNDGKGLAVYAPLSVRELFIHPTNGFEDIHQIFTNGIKVKFFP